MDPDVMITIAFCLEVLLFALAGGLFVAHEVRKDRAEAGPASAKVSAAKAGSRVTARAPGAVRGMHS